MGRHLASTSRVTQHLQRVELVVRRAAPTHINPRAIELVEDWCGEVDTLALGGQLSSMFDLLSEDVIGLLATASPGRSRPEFLFAALDVSVCLGALYGTPGRPSSVAVERWRPGSASDAEQR